MFSVYHGDPRSVNKAGRVSAVSQNKDTRLLDSASSSDIALAIRLLEEGALVAVPTETVYGLAADAMNPEAVKQIFTAKGRPSDHPLIVHIGSAQCLSRWAVDIPPLAFTMAAAFWPGPLTLLLKKSPQVPDEVTAGGETIGLRVPAHPVLLELLTSSGMGLAAPSANPYKRLSPTSAAQVLSQMAGRIDAVLDGGDCQVGLESTILDMSGEQLQILRNGPVTASQIAAVAGQVVLTPRQHQIAVPGNVAVHYQPRTPLYVADRARMLEALQAHEERVALVFVADTAALPSSPSVRSLPADKASYAQALYRTLHELDALQLDAIWLERPPVGEQWSDVHDRLNRAASPS